jgi:hypothetical protein
MLRESRKTNLRRPRYDSTDGQKVQVEVERKPGSQPAMVWADLRNLSRNGFQIQTPVALEIQEHITLHLCIKTSGFRLVLPGTVRWQRPEDDAWLLGCLSDEPVDWESLGELFLNQILSTGDVA